MSSLPQFLERPVRLSQVPSTLAPPVLSGYLVQPGPPAIRQGLLLLSDLAIFRHALSFISYLLGSHSQVELNARDGALELRVASELLGTRVADKVELIPYTALRRVHSERSLAPLYSVTLSMGLMATLVLLLVAVAPGLFTDSGPIWVVFLAIFVLNCALDLFALIRLDRRKEGAGAHLTLDMKDRQVLLAGLERTATDQFIRAVQTHLMIARDPHSAGREG